MQELFKLINKYNKKYMLDQKEAKSLVLSYNKLWKDFGLSMDVKDDFDYIDFQVRMVSYENMQAIKNKFFLIKESLSEIWNVIDYKEKHFLLYQELAGLNDQLPSFYYNDKRHFIAYFETLINAYYNHDMLMFDNENYRKYLYNYESLIVENPYGIKPLEAKFVDIDFLLGDDSKYVIFKADIKRFYLIEKLDDQVSKLSFGLGYHINDRQIQELAAILLDYDEYNFIWYLVNEKIVNKRLAKKLSKLLIVKGDVNEK